MTCVSAVCAVFLLSLLHSGQAKRLVAKNYLEAEAKQHSPRKKERKKRKHIYSSEDEEKNLLASRVAQCIDPEVTASERWMDVLDSAAQTIKEGTAVAQKAGRKARLLKTPITASVKQIPVGWLVPHLIPLLNPFNHKKVEKNSDNPLGVPDAACFSLDKYNEDGPDVDGCRTFRKSFKPVAELRACIFNHLQQDSKWQAHRVNLTWQQWCANEFPDCEDYDTYRRAEEIIKNVAFKPLNHPNSAALRDHLIQKAGTSKVLMEGADVNQETAEAIADECYGANLAGEAQKLWGYSQCLPLMYDALEWGAMSMFDAAVKFGRPNHVNNDEPSPYKKKLGKKHKAAPVCARLAAGLIAQQFEHAKFGVEDQTAVVTRNWKFTKDCVNPAKGNCRKFATCWELALPKACLLNDACC